MLTLFLFLAFSAPLPFEIKTDLPPGRYEVSFYTNKGVCQLYRNGNLEVSVDDTHYVGDWTWNPSTRVLVLRMRPATVETLPTVYVIYLNRRLSDVSLLGGHNPSPFLKFIGKAK